MQAAFEKLRDFFHGCDYEQALDAKPQAALLVYLRTIDHVFGQNDGWQRLRRLVKELSAAFALAVPRQETEVITPHLNDQIRTTERTNIVQSRKFREALEDAMLRYTNRAITTAEMISRLIDLAKSLRDAQRHGDELGPARKLLSTTPWRRTGQPEKRCRAIRYVSWPGS